MSLPSTDPAAVQVYAEENNRLRQVDHASVQQVYWQHRQSTKRGPPTPLDSAAGTPMGDLPRGGAASGSDQTTSQEIPPTLVHPFTVDDGAATQITAGLMGVDINQPQRVEEWLQAPVTTTQDVMKILRCYHKNVIRPELHNMVLQVETALRTGVSKGKTKKHWSAPFTYNSYAVPFPFELDVVSVEAIAFSWDECCTKSGGEAHRVNDPKACTYVGKPVVEDHTASPAPEMGSRRPKAGDPDYETTFLSGVVDQAPIPPKGASKGAKAAKKA